MGPHWPKLTSLVKKKTKKKKQKKKTLDTLAVFCFVSVFFALKGQPF